MANESDSAPDPPTVTRTTSDEEIVFIPPTNEGGEAVPISEQTIVEQTLIEETPRIEQTPVQVEQIMTVATSKSQTDGPQKDVVVVGQCNKDLSFYADRFPNPGETILGHNFQQGFGGKGANQAVMCGKVLSTISKVEEMNEGEVNSGSYRSKAHLISKLGADSIAAETRINLKEHGIDDSHVFEDDTGAPSGTAMITVAGGENCIIVVGGANDKLSAEEDIAKKSKNLLCSDNTGIVVCQLEVPAEISKKVFEVVKGEDDTNNSNKTLTVLNPSPVPANLGDAHTDPDSEKKVKTFWELLGLTDVLIPNEQELCDVMNASEGFRLNEMNVGPGLSSSELVVAVDMAFGNFPNLKLIVCTRGSKGCVVLGKNNSSTSGGSGGFKVIADVPAIPILPEKVIDTTGAGDCFLGAFCGVLARKIGGFSVDKDKEGSDEVFEKTLGEAAGFACAAATLCVTKKGTQSSYPDAAEVQEFINRNKGPQGF